MAQYAIDDTVSIHLRMRTSNSMPIASAISRAFFCLLSILRIKAPILSFHPFSSLERQWTMAVIDVDFVESPWESVARLVVYLYSRYVASDRRLSSE